MVTDRTQQDVDDAKAIREEKIKQFIPLTQAEIETIERGMLTVNVLNRIEAKQADVKERLNECGYWNTDITNRSWLDEYWLFAEDWQRLLSNTETLKQAFYGYDDTPDTPDAELNFGNLNAIEKILVDTEDVISDMQEQYRRCGTFACGGD